MNIESDFIRETITYPGKEKEEKERMMWEATPVTITMLSKDFIPPLLLVQMEGHHSKRRNPNFWLIQSYP
jgi:hypothetical protein